MERIAAPAESAVKAAIHSASRPRRRWSDGPNYTWSAIAPEEGSTHWPELLAVLCEQISAETRKISQHIDRLQADGRLSGAEAGAVARSAQALHRAGLTAQQIIRLGAGSVQPAGERVDLTQLARDVIRERQPDLIRLGAEVRIDIRPAEVLLDPSVAVKLMNSALDWALSFSRCVKVKIELGGPAKPIRLSVRGQLAPPAGSGEPAAQRPHDRRMNANLYWYLLRQLASCAQIRISRSSTGATESAILEFPRPYEFTDGFAIVELLPGGTQAPLKDSWVLAVVRDARLRETVSRLLLQNGLEVSVVENCEKAKALCQARRPRAMVACFDSPEAVYLRRDLVADGASCAMVHIVRARPTFQNSGFSGHDQVRVARADLERELVPAVLFEIAQQA